MKVGASVVCARRGGCSATFDELNKFFTISNMPIASSRYWNSIHGCEKGEAEMDEEGKQTMRREILEERGYVLGSAPEEE